VVPHYYGVHRARGLASFGEWKRRPVGKVSSRLANAYLAFDEALIAFREFVREPRVASGDPNSVHRSNFLHNASPKDWLT